MFETENALLSSLIKPWIAGAIEHVGSTAVVGLAVKPVIDIMVGVQSLQSSRAAIKVLTDKGHCYTPYKTERFVNLHLRLEPIIYTWYPSTVLCGRSV